MDTLLVFTNVPDQECAQRMARMLVENRLAACVNILAPCHSIYRWQDGLESADEIPLLIKTTLARYTAVEEAIRQQHPYAVPEIIALPITQGLPAYVRWVTESSASDASPYPPYYA